MHACTSSSGLDHHDQGRGRNLIDVCWYDIYIHLYKLHLKDGLTDLHAGTLDIYNMSDGPGLTASVASPGR